MFKATDMDKNVELEQLCGEIPKREFDKVDFANMVTRYTKHPDYHPDNEFPLYSYIRSFKQILLNIVLDDIAAEHPELSISIEYKLPEKNEREDSCFVYDSSKRLFLSQDYEPKNRYLCSRLIAVNNLRVIVDMVSNRLTRHLKSHQYKIALHTIRSYLRDDVGYVIVLPKGGYDEIMEKRLPDVERFLKEGGLLTHFSMGRNEFKKAFEDAIKYFNFKLKTETHSPTAAPTL